MSKNNIIEELSRIASPRVWPVIVPSEHAEKPDRPYVRLRSLTMDELGAVEELGGADLQMAYAVALGLDEMGGNWSYVGLPENLSAHWPPREHPSLEEILTGQIDIKRPYVEQRKGILARIFTLNELAAIYGMQRSYERGSTEEKKPLSSAPAPSFGQSTKRA